MIRREGKRSYFLEQRENRKKQKSFEQFADTPPETPEREDFEESEEESPRSSLEESNEDENRKEKQIVTKNQPVKRVHTPSRKIKEPQSEVEAARIARAKALAKKKKQQQILKEKRKQRTKDTEQIPDGNVPTFLDKERMEKTNHLVAVNGKGRIKVNGNTSGRKRHLRTHRVAVIQENIPVDQNTIVNGLLDLFIHHDIALRVANCDCFKTFVNSINPQVPSPYRDTSEHQLVVRHQFGVVVFWINQGFEFNVKLLDFKEQSNHEAIFTKTMISYKRLWYIKVYWRSCRRCHKFYDIHY